MELDKQQFCYLSPWQSILTSGNLLTLDVANVESTDELLGAVQHGFSLARQKGCENPVLVGVWPFDRRQKPFLYIPQSHTLDKAERILNLYHDSSRKKINNIVIKQEFLCSQQKFKDNVTAAVAAIRKQQLTKVVLAQQQRYSFAASVDCQQLLAQLYQQNLTSYCYSINLPQGNLVGASPELLARSAGGTITIFPLAGSLSRLQGESISSPRLQQLLKTEKNLFEHAVVVDEIKRQLEKTVTHLKLPPVPQIVATAKLWHLGTPIGGVSDLSYPSLRLLLDLYPTAALCGFPRQQAYEFILNHEPVARNYFAGAVGWCDARGYGEWAVVIRSAFVTANQATLFAGAGIVAQSDADQEWQETQTKLQVVLSALS